MSIIKTEAFVLKSFNYGDTSKIVTLFTKDRGKLNVIVKGVRNFKSRYCGIFNTMNYISTVIYIKDARDIQNVSSAERIRSFDNISCNLDKLSSAFMIMETVNKSSYEGDINPVLFDLLFRSFIALDAAENNFINYVLFFQFHLARINGFAPGIDNSDGEGETFNIQNKVKLNEKQISALNYLMKNDVNDLSGFFIDDETLSLLRSFLDDYIADNTDHKRLYKTKKVFRELKSS